MFPAREIMEAGVKEHSVHSWLNYGERNRVSAWGVRRGKVAYHVQPTAPCHPLWFSGDTGDLREWQCVSFAKAVLESNKFGGNHVEREETCPSGRVHSFFPCPDPSH